MRTRIQRWGNSLAVRIPRPFADETGLEQGSEVDLTLHEGAIVVRPCRHSAASLDQLLAGITDANIHGEVDWGPAQGSETW